MKRAEEILAWYKAHVGEGLLSLVSFLGFDTEEVSAEGCVVQTADGREMLDFLGCFGALNLGHRHPRVVAAVWEGLERMGLATKVLLNGDQAQLSARLSEMSPGDLSCVFLCNSGTEAVEAAIKFARAKTGRGGILHCENSYHGKTLGSLSAAGRERFRAPFGPLLPEFSTVPFGDADALAAAMNRQPAAFLVEPIQGEAGVRVPPDGYLAAARQITEESGVLLIVDEVQTGLGRTGRMLACEHDGVAPDILCLAKSLGGGIMPIGATIATPAVWEIFAENPLLHSSTFGGNHLACRAALATLEVLQDERLAERAARLGERLLAGLDKLDSSLVVAVRGRGLLVGVEFADSDVAGLVISALAADSIMVAYTLNNPEVMRLEPPLVVNEEQIDRFLAAFATALDVTATLVEELTTLP
ncbi:aspartate aminotransferase family protein [bacterium]|nr:aspartate aminotransferase family protein [bacterium]